MISRGWEEQEEGGSVRCWACHCEVVEFCVQCEMDVGRRGEIDCFKMDAVSVDSAREYAYGQEE